MSLTDIIKRITFSNQHQIYKCVARLRDPFCISVPNFVKIGQFAGISRDFQDGGRRHLGFPEIRNFNGRSAVRGKCESPCQISSKLVKRLQRYGNLMVFKIIISSVFHCCLQCFDAVGWAAGRASGL